jgi:dihydroneopterin aldolase
MDSIAILGLKTSCRIGVTDQERAQPQTVLVDLVVDIDTKAAARSDDVADTVDYGAITSGVVALVEAFDGKLLERLAEQLASWISGLSGVQGVTVEVAKASPPIEEDTDRVGIRIVRNSG